MNKLFCVFSFALVVHFPADSLAQSRASYKACLAIAARDNEHLPLRIDAGTTVVGVSCREAGGRVIFVYDNKLDSTKIDLETDAIKRQAQATRAMLCSNPDLNRLLQIVDMEYIYYDTANVFLGKITNRIEDCEKL